MLRSGGWFFGFVMGVGVVWQDTVLPRSRLEIRDLGSRSGGGCFDRKFAPDL